MANAWFFAPLPIVAAAASSMSAGHLPLYVGNDHAGIVWESNAEASPWVRVDLGADTSIDTIALFGLAGFTAGNTLTIQTATAAQGSGFGAGAFTAFTAAPTPVLAGSVMPEGGKGIGLFSIEAPVTARYVKILFSGLSAAVQLARCAIGARLPLERNFGFGGNFGVRDLGSVDFSARGVLLRRFGTIMRTVALTFSNIHKDEVQAYTKPLLKRLGNTRTVALIVDPSADAYRQDTCYFGFLVGDLGHVQRNAVGWEAKFNVVSIF
jgi:hypothetical protein